MTPNASKNLLRKLINLFLKLGTLYSLVVSAILLLRKHVTEDNLVIGYFNSFAHVLMLPSLILLPLNLLFRPSSAWFEVIPVAHLIAAYGRRYGLRQPLATRAANKTIKVLTFNLHGESKRLDPIVAILRESNADVISVQELNRVATDCFKSTLIELYPYQVLHTAAQSDRGQGVFSKYPITTEHYWRNPQIAFYSMGHLRVEIDFAGTPITLYNTHPLHPGIANDGFDTRPRGEEIDIVLKYAAKDSGAVLIMGDFNMTDQNEDYERITQHFGDSFHEVGRGMGFTFPDLSTLEKLPRYWPLPVRFVPFLRLDFIFHSAALQPISARVWPTAGGSDHRPVWAEFSFVDEKHA